MRPDRALRPLHGVKPLRARSASTPRSGAHPASGPFSFVSQLKSCSHAHNSLPHTTPSLFTQSTSELSLLPERRRAVKARSQDCIGRANQFARQVELLPLSPKTIPISEHGRTVVNARNRLRTALTHLRIVRLQIFKVTSKSVTNDCRSPLANLHRTRLSSSVGRKTQSSSRPDDPDPRVRLEFSPIPRHIQCETNAQHLSGAQQ